ncbi:bifunctional helix-turn-helix transcriptional regulator/GNAT family N-acetyltransferase [Thalassospira mesophila]|nr:helix-turn-helix domain-containing GNAT family N-acetyltransferase [Thalassospira mesophila]
MTVNPIREASRRLVRELGFMKPTLAGTDMPPSSVHTLVEIGRRGILTASELCEVLGLEKSSVSRLVQKLVRAGELVEGASAHDGRAKPLCLTPKGRETLARIDAFASAQVRAALQCLPPHSHATVHQGMGAYADALAASRTKTPVLANPAPKIMPGYQPGIIGRVVEMHAHYYANISGFGAFFESKVASGMAEFAGRLDHRVNQIWAATDGGGHVVGSIAIDGEDLGDNSAHLRWFIVGDGQRGSGVGRALLRQALSFCDACGFAKTRLWTFKGLDAARKLYEANGFILENEQTGQQWGTEVTEQTFVRDYQAG